MLRFLLCTLLVVVVARPPAAQPEVVPAEHPVYDLLLDGRAAGHLPGYRHEILPLGRGEVRRHLDSLATHEEKLSPGTINWVRSFQREFGPEADEVHAWAGDGEASRLDLDAERFMAYSASEDGEIRVLARAGAQFRSSQGPTETGDPLEAASGAALFPELVVSGHWRNLVGIYSGTFNGLQVGGDTRVLRADPEIASLYYVGFSRVPPPGSFDRSSASLRVRRGPFSAEIANERMRIGPSPADPLILTDASDYFPFVRVGFEKGPVRYQALHGALSDRTAFVNEPGDIGLRSPERYLATHRLEGHVQGASFGFTEAVVYGLRGPEIAYLNPLFPIKPAEHALWDRDNSLFALDAVVRPLRGVEVHGTYLADDINLSRIGESLNNNNKWAMQAGLSVGGLVPGVTLFGEYTRIDPFVYTHRFISGESYYNSYTHNGFTLGHPLGPNADQWIAGAKAWLPGGLRAEAEIRYARRGENPMDPETGETIQVGGDVRDGSQFTPYVKEFLGGDVFEGPGATIDLLWEPVNSLTARALLDWQSWNPGPDRLFVRLAASVQL